MNFKKYMPHLLACLAFLFMMLLYFSPYFFGKTLSQGDITESIGALKEINQYKQNGESILWSNSSFSGMPFWSSSELNIFKWIHNIFRVIAPLPILLMFLAFIGFYILLTTFRVKPWLAFAGATAYALSSFNMISILAGHANKVYDMVYMAPLLAGIFLVYKGKYLKGALLTIFTLGMEIFYNHIQINYYLLIMILGIAIAELIVAIREDKIKAFTRASLILVGSAIIAISANITSLWSLAEYAESSTRGGSELTSKKTEGNGLDKDYAFSWSLGKLETATLFIPYFYGGGSSENLGEKSNSYKELISHGVPRQQAKSYVKNFPTYWGSQPFTVGPVYVGAIVFYLFVLALFLFKGRIKWWALSLTVLSIVLAWGKNFEIVSDFFFYYVPLYNKFRSVTMILVIAELTMPFLAILTLSKILEGEYDKPTLKKAVLKSLYICGGFAVAMLLFGTTLFDFSNPNDTSRGLPDWILSALREDRIHLFKVDAMRSLFFVVVSAGLIWAYSIQKIKLKWVYLSFILLIIIDMWPVNKRYINESSYVEKITETKQNFPLTKTEKKILDSDSSTYRVLSFLHGNPFSESKTSYYHKSVGGYSAIKLGRYQELIEAYLSKNHMPVLNMLNTKYFFMPNEKGGEPLVQQNPNAMGNAWFVKEIQLVGNADEELAALSNLKPAEVAYVDQRFSNEVNGALTFTAEGAIELTNYHPENMEYFTSSKSQQFVLFSEIYYQPGWQAYIDGIPAPHVRADYVLRGMLVPEGEHKIVFKFNPNSYSIGDKIGISASVLIIIMVLFSLFWYYKKEQSLK